MKNKLFVGNLAYKVQDDELRQHFEQAGQVSAVKVVTDRETGRSRGFGFVEFVSAEASEIALRTLDNTELFGRPISVKVAEEKPRGERPRQQGFGGQSPSYNSQGGSREPQQPASYNSDDLGNSRGWNNSDRRERGDRRGGF